MQASLLYPGMAFFYLSSAGVKTYQRTNGTNQNTADNLTNHRFKRSMVG